MKWNVNMVDGKFSFYNPQYLQSIHMTYGNTFIANPNELFGIMSIALNYIYLNEIPYEIPYELTL